MLRRRTGIAVVAALGFVLPIWGTGAAAPAAPAVPTDTVSASVSGQPTGPALPDGFVGISAEYRALHQYTGRNPLAVDPVMVALLKGLAPGQPFSIRVGGDSADGTWWPIPHVLAPGGIYYRLTDGWLRTTRALAAALDAKLILDINLAAGRPGIAAAEGRALLQGIGRRYIQAFEIGNEPDLYSVFTWYRDRRGHLYRARGRHYRLPQYAQDFTRWSHALPRIPLAGPAVSGPPWLRGLAGFIKSEPRLGLITYHRYPLRACVSNPSAPDFPSIPNLLNDRSSAGLASGLAQFVTVAHRHRLPFRLSEINSASCEGAAGVSDTFASALWALNTMFNLAKVGVDGVNFHMLPGSHYELFTPSETSSGSWQAIVHPEYYGLYMFGQAFPPGAQLLPVSAPAGPLKIWATQSNDGAVRVTLINQDPTIDHQVQVSISGHSGAGSLESLTAPSLSATDGVTLGGQTFDPATTTGTFPAPPAGTAVLPVGSTYTVDVPPASAALLSTQGTGGGGTPLVRSLGRPARTASRPRP